MFVSFLLPFVDRGQGPLFHWVMLKQLEVLGDQTALIADDRYFSQPAPWGQPISMGGFQFRCPSRDCLEKALKFAIPAEIFRDLEQRSRSQLETFRVLLTEDYPPLREALVEILDTLTQGQRIEAVLAWCNTPSLSQAAAQFNLPVIHNECGPLRPPLYHNTCYFDVQGVNGNTAAAAEMARFCQEAKSWPHFQPLELAEIRALLACSPHVSNTSSGSPRFRAGVALQVEDDSNLLAYANGLTNFKAIFSARQGLQPSEVLMRQHPLGHADYSSQLAVRDTSADSVSFLRKCQRVLTINSSVAFECLLQDKSVRVLGDSPASALSAEKLAALSEEDRLLSLNYLFLAYLVPARFLYDLDYYRWRLAPRSLQERYNRHLETFRELHRSVPLVSAATPSEPFPPAVAKPAEAAAARDDSASQPAVEVPHPLASQYRNGPAISSTAAPTPSLALSPHPIEFDRTRVLFVSHEASRTGAPMVLLHFLRWLREHTPLKFEVLLGRGGPLEDEFAKLGPTHRPDSLLNNPKALQRFDLIYSNTVCNGLLLQQLPCGTTPIITHIHELDFGYDCTGATGIAAVIKQTNHFIACARIVADRFHHRFNVPRDEFSVHYESIPFDSVNAAAQTVSPQVLREQYNLPADAFIFAACGTLDTRKGADLFVQLAARLTRRLNTQRPLRFLWIGKTHDVGFQKTLAWDLERLNLQNHVQFVGELASPHSLLALADVFCLPSREDPFPLVMMEAGALGKPVVGFEESGGCGEFCALGGGVAVPLLDLDAMAQACEKLVFDSQWHAEISRRATELVRTRFNTAVVLPQLWEELETLLMCPPAISRHRVADSGLEEVFAEWPLEGAPEGISGLLKASRDRVVAGQPELAVKILGNAVNSAVRMGDPDFIFECLLVIARELTPLDPPRGLFLLKKAESLRQNLLKQRKLQRAHGQANNQVVNQAVPATAQPAEEPPAALPVLALLPSSGERKPPVPPVATIVLLVFNQLEHTRKCLESIAARTDLPHEVIVVDNGSTDGTPEYLKEWQAAHPNCIVIRNLTNRGFAAGNNQGLAIARGQHVVLLNNDAVVTEGWLEHLLRVLEQHPQAGLVGPMSNSVSGPQLVPIVAYKTLDQLPAFAAQWAADHQGQSVEVNRLAGFCLLAKREVIERIGGLDEQFGSGNFEDDDFGLRARLSGFKLRIAQDVFIHHTGGQTFKGAGIDYSQAMLRNWQLFCSKWALPKAAISEFRYPVPAELPQGVAVRYPLPSLEATHHASGRNWTEKADSGVLTMKREPPSVAQVGDLSEARALRSQRNFSAAWQATLNALRARPFHPEAWLMLGEIAWSVGDGQHAKACAEHARRIAPGFKGAKRLLNQRLKGNSRPQWLTLPEFIFNRSAAGRNALSVCLITRNEEQFISQCLASVRGLAQQIIIVDTGSTDRTVELAKAQGAEVYHFDWCDDFSAARNVALEHATGDWVLMLDADEELPAESHEPLRKLLANPAVMAWRLPIVDVGREDEGCCYVPRLFRNAPGLFYTGRIHEQVFPSLRPCCEQWGLETRLGDAGVRHHGYRPEVVKSRDKIQRNLRLLEKAIQEAPADANLLMNYGLELARSGRSEEGLEQYRRAFELMSARPTAEIPAETREMLLTQFSTQLMARRQFDEIVRLLTSPLAKTGGLTSSLHFSLGLALFELKEISTAAEQMRRCLAKRHEPSLAPINKEIRKAGPQHCLALCLLQLGQIDEAAAAFSRALAEDSQSRPVRLDYADFLATQGKPVEALKLFHALATEEPADLCAWQRGGQLTLSRPDFLDVALDWTATAHSHFPMDAVLLQQRAEALTLVGDCAAALPLWRRLAGNSEPHTLAALALCEVLTADAPSSISSSLETRVSQAFLKWYQRLLQFGAGEFVETLNGHIEGLAAVLPSAAGVLSAALAEAAEPAGVLA